MPPLWPVPRAYSHATGLHEAAAPAAITPDGHLVVGGLTQAGASRGSRQRLRSPHDVPSGVALRGRTEGAHQAGAEEHLPRRDRTRNRSARAVTTGPAGLKG
jgi:hypothetical protein